MFVAILPLLMINLVSSSIQPLIIYDLKVEQLKRQIPGREIAPNYQVMIYDYGELPNHAKNCTTFPGEIGIMINCEDGWISVGSLDDFKKSSSSINYDTSELIPSKNIQFAKEFQNFSIFVDADSHNFYIFEHITAKGYIQVQKRGQYSLDYDQDQNRQKNFGLNDRNDFAWNIRGFVTPENVYELSLIPGLREKGELATLYHEIHLSMF